MKSILLLLSATAMLTASCAAEPEQQPRQTLSQLSVADGYEIGLYGQVRGARSLALSDSGTVYVGSRGPGHVYALVDADQDGVAEQLHKIASDLNSPNGVAWKDGALFVAEIHRILRYDNIDKQLASPPEPIVVVDDLPTESHHGWRYIAVGPDDKLYVSIGVPCNVCQRDGFGTIIRMNADGSDRETVARGVRNSVGFDWNPEDNSFWFTDNGRDWLGDDAPADELNRLGKLGEHFGFPYCHGGDVADPDFAKGRSCDEFQPPVAKLQAHVAPLGMAFWRDLVLVAEHGSWNRSEKVGYQITALTPTAEGAKDQRRFVSGWLSNQPARETVTGRPVDLLPLTDGSLLVSDDFAGAIYRIKPMNE